MNSSSTEPATACHVAVMPFPGRSHINPMMNLCKLISSKRPDILITFVVTEEWLGYVGSEPKPTNVRFATIPNVVPPESLVAADIPAFFEAVVTNTELPFDRLLDCIDPPPTAIVADLEVLWGVRVGKRRNLPVALFWTMSVSFFSTLYHFNVVAEAKNLTLDFLADCGREDDRIHGLSSSQLADLRTVFRQTDKRVLKLALECISQASKAQYLLFTSVHELEPRETNTLRAQFTFAVLPIGPAIPYLELNNDGDEKEHYFQWLDSQPRGSVLYISLGSFLSVSSAQMDEIAAGLCASGVRFLWVARSEASRLSRGLSGGDHGSAAGLVIPWCDQLRVLCHPSVGGFWTHCGWNSTLEALFGGVPLLTFPLFLDQFSNSRRAVEEWEIGVRVEDISDESLASNMRRERVCEVVKRFMDSESDGGREIRKRSRELGEVCHRAVVRGGSSDVNLDYFIRGICQNDYSV